jgi:hypothetical protein
VIVLVVFDKIFSSQNFGVIGIKERPLGFIGPAVGCDLDFQLIATGGWSGRRLVVAEIGDAVELIASDLLDPPHSLAGSSINSRLGCLGTSISPGNDTHVQMNLFAVSLDFFNDWTARVTLATIFSSIFEESGAHHSIGNLSIIVIPLVANVVIDSRDCDLVEIFW